MHYGRGRGKNRTFVPFVIKPFERPFVSQEGTPSFVKPLAVKSMARHSLALRLPEVFDFDEDYDSAAIVIGIFRRALMENCRIGYIDFSMMKRISPACLTVFSCYADLWKDHQPQVTPWTHTWHPNILTSFEQIGFFDTLGFDKKQLPVSKGESPIRYMGLRKYSMDAPLIDIGIEAKTIREEIEEFAKCSFNKQAMFASVTEAITNIKDHAYTSEVNVALKRKWWLSVSYDSEQSILHVIIFDRGLGIPTTMLTSSKFMTFRKVYYQTNLKWSQRDRLELAFERFRNPDAYARAVPVSSGRGNGCGDLLQMVGAAKSNQGKSSFGMLSVISQKARYTYVADASNDDSATAATHIPLEGTLLEWRITI